MSNTFKPDDPAKFLEIREGVVDAFESLVTDFPDTPEYQAELAMAHYHVGLSQVDQDQVDAATEAFLDAERLLQSLLVEYPDLRDYENRLIRVLLLLEEICHRSGQYERGLANEEKLLPLMKEAATGSTRHWLVTLDLAELGRVEESLDRAKFTWSQREDRVATAPDQLRSDTLQQDWLYCRAYSEVLHSAGFLEEATAYAEKAIGRCRKKLELDPDYSDAKTALAGLLVASPQRSLHDPDRALELSTEVISQDPNSPQPSARRVRAIAYLRLKQWEKALQDAKQCIFHPNERVGPEVSATDCYIMALASDRLGLRDEANVWLTQGERGKDRIDDSTSYLHTDGHFFDHRTSQAVMNRMRTQAHAAVDSSKVPSQLPFNAVISELPLPALAVLLAPDSPEVSDHLTLLRMASTFAFVEDEAKYRQACERMQECSAPENHYYFQALCKACTILPNVIDPEELPITELEHQLQENQMPAKDRQWFTIARAMGRYRLGNFQSALVDLAETQQQEAYADTPVAQALVGCIQSMCQHQIGESTEAKKSLASAESLLESHRPELLNDEFGDAWHDWLIAEVLRRQAATLLAAARP